MDEVYGSVINFPKIPCTPISSAYSSYYDVFGDVERISSGSTDGQSEFKAQRHGSRLSDQSRTDHFNNNCNIVHHPYIVFLQDKQQEVLSALHDEVRLLKHENSELKFQIHVILEQDSTLDRLSTFPSQASKSSLRVSPDKKGEIVGSREKILELELESATKMIEELKWVQQHYEKKVRFQEIKIDDLERQLNLTEDNCNVLPIQVSPSIYQIAKAPSTTNYYVNQTRQRSSTVNHQKELVNRRNSAQSILPDDYKEMVATLPPISATPGSNANGNSVKPPLSTAPSARKYGNDNSSSRKLSLINSTPSLVRNTPAFIGDNAGQQNAETQFYFSK